MPEEQGGQEKTEDATPKRLRDARKKGQVARSRDLNTIVLLIAAFILIAFLKDYMGEGFRLLMQAQFALVGRPDLSIEEVILQAQHAFFSCLKILLPFLGGLALTALAVSFLQIGPIFSGEPMKPQLKRLNIVENVKNMFKVTTLVELLKNIAKISVIFLLAYLVIKADLRQVILTVTGTPDQAVQIAVSLLVSFLIKVFIVFIAIALIDFWVQRWQYKKQLRMTKDEVKREYKQDEGDPLIRSARRQLHQELAMSDVQQKVGASDVVITNPTSVAVALKYDELNMLAPAIMAKGQRLFADMIREIAETQGIPIVQNVPLAWSLIELDVGDEIPEDLFTAVAEILVYVYKMKEKTKSGVSA